MRVLHVTPSHARRFGGPSEVLRGLLPQLVAQGLMVKALTTDKGHTASDDDFPRLGFEVRVARSRPPASLNYASDFLRPLRELTAWADLIHVHSVHTYTTTAALTVARRLDRPVLLEPHGALDAYHLAQSPVKKRIYSRVFDRWGSAAIAGVLYSSDREARDGRLQLDRPAHLVPLGVDPALFTLQRHTAQTGRLEILYLGRITRKKRLDLLLSAVASSPSLRRGVRLTIAGPADVSWGFDARRFAHENELDDVVEFVGEVDSAQRAALLQRASIFVLPSEDESFGVAVAEAMAAGVAVVASAEVGLVQDAAKADAVRVCQLDAQSLRRELEVLASDVAAASELGRKAREYAAARFTWHASAEATVHAYRDILARRASPTA